MSTIRKQEEIPENIYFLDTRQTAEKCDYWEKGNKLGEPYPQPSFSA